MDQTTCMLMAVMAAIIVIIIAICFDNKRDNFIQNKKIGVCSTDSDCPADGFCYDGECWPYWNGYTMPWNDCRNPYCENKPPNDSCKTTSATCHPYCKYKPVRQPSGDVSNNCFPMCGDTCMNDTDCPAGCPTCSMGRCMGIPRSHT